MSLKQIIKQKMILNKIIGRPFVMPGEPMIYSIKYPVGQRTRGLQFYRNMQWKSLLKSNFRSFYSTKIPVVLLVRFFVSVPKGIKVSDKLLRQESLPAVKCFELCDYTLSFMEMLHHVLINSYRQIVKLDVEKFYSKNPRTEMKFMKWDEYVELQSNNTLHAEAESLSPDVTRKMVQSNSPRDATSNRVRKKSIQRQAATAPEGTAPCDNALCAALPSQCAAKKKRSAKLPTSYKEAGRRQPGEVS